MIVPDVEKDAGWLVDTPWVGRFAAVFGVTKDDALAQANRSRADFIAELQAKIDRCRSYQFEARFVDRMTDNASA